MTEHEQNLRDLAAMFAMAALLIRDKTDGYPFELAFRMADAFMEHRKPVEGIAAIKKPRKRDVQES
jgi:hypothetical protein